jgi:5'(3')-deoxyribonucleotidase
MLLQIPQKKIILVDQDDTIVDLVRPCVTQHNIRWSDHPIDYEKVVSWELDTLWHPECTLKDFFGVPGLYENLPPVDEYVVDELEKLSKQYEVIIVTAAYPDNVPEKWRSMQRLFPFISLENFMTVKKKYLINGDMLIDDGVHNLIPFSETGRPVIGIPRPWNTSIRNQILFKQNGWKGMKETVDSIFEEGGLGREVLSPLSTG